MLVETAPREARKREKRGSDVGRNVMPYFSEKAISKRSVPTASRQLIILFLLLAFVPVYCRGRRSPQTGNL